MVYTIQYQFGGWHKANTLFAESDEEAIFDCDRTRKKAIKKLTYGLFKGSELIKVYYSDEQRSGIQSGFICEAWKGIKNNLNDEVVAMYDECESETFLTI